MFSEDMKIPTIFLCCLIIVGCSKEPSPAKLLQTVSLEDAAASKNWEGLLEGLVITPADRPVNKKDLAGLNYILLQTYYLSATDKSKRLMVKRSWPIFRTVDATLRNDKRWLSFLHQNEGKDSVDAEAMGNVVGQTLPVAK